MNKEQVMNPNKKELTALECIESLETLFKAYKNDSEFNYQLSVSNSPFNTLKKFLMSQPCNETVKPSEALECLEKVSELQYIDHYESREKEIEIIEQALIKAQKQEKENAELKKVLRLIKEKRVEMNLLINSNTLGEYNVNRNWGAKMLTQEEFETLKRWSETARTKQL